MAGLLYGVKRRTYLRVYNAVSYRYGSTAASMVMKAIHGVGGGVAHMNLVGATVSGAAYLTAAVGAAAAYKAFDAFSRTSAGKAVMEVKQGFDDTVENVKDMKQAIDVAGYRVKHAPSLIERAAVKGIANKSVEITKGAAKGYVNFKFNPVRGAIWGPITDAVVNTTFGAGKAASKTKTWRVVRATANKAVKTGRTWSTRIRHPFRSGFRGTVKVAEVGGKTVVTFVRDTVSR